MIIADQHRKDAAKQPGDRREETRKRAPAPIGHSRSANPEQDEKPGEDRRKPGGRDARYVESE